MAVICKLASQVPERPNLYARHFCLSTQSPTDLGFTIYVLICQLARFPMNMYPAVSQEDAGPDATGPRG